MKEALDELSTLVADLRAWAQWERARGAWLVPAEEPLPSAPAEEPARDSSRPSAPRRVAAPPPRRAPPPSRRVPPSPPPAPATAPAGPRSLGLWARHAEPAPPPADDGLRGVETLEGVRDILGDCQRCGLARGRHHLVFGAGAARPRLLIVGEGPGYNEDKQGQPFVGKAGQMLDRMLQNVLGLGRDQVYITNVVKCRPPDNRNPQPDEITACLPFLHAQLRVLRPPVVLVLGSVAARTLFETRRGVTALRGSWRTLAYPGGEVRAMASFHPAYLLRQPQHKREALQDLLMIKAALAEQP